MFPRPGLALLFFFFKIASLFGQLTAGGLEKAFAENTCAAIAADLEKRRSLPRR